MMSEAGRCLVAMMSILLLGGCLGGGGGKAPVVHYGIDEGAGSAGIHTVSRGDTIYEISQRYNMPMRDLIARNAISPPYRLDVGQRLRLPPPRTYKVRKGDTLYEISRLFGMNVTDLARRNNIGPPYRIRPGKTLRLPARKSDRGRNVEVASHTGAGGTSRPSVRPAEKPELRRARQALPDATPPRSSGRFLMPVNGRLISTFGPKENGLHNDGINIRAPQGTPVRAAENGVVVYTGRELEGFGNLVLVRHADRWMSAYAHMDKTLVQRGDQIKRGQSLGTVGRTGSVETPQLHFELRRGTKAINPLKYTGSGA